MAIRKRSLLNLIAGIVAAIALGALGSTTVNAEMCCQECSCVQLCCDPAASGGCPGGGGSCNAWGPNHPNGGGGGCSNYCGDQLSISFTCNSYC